MIISTLHFSFHWNKSLNFIYDDDNYDDVDNDDDPLNQLMMTIYA